MKYHLKYRFPKNFASSLKYRSGIVCLAIVGAFLLAKDWLNENFGFTFGDSYDGLAPVLEEIADGEELPF